jgi:hypothetical protein
MLKKDGATIMGRETEVALNLTISDHYCISMDQTVKVPFENVNAVDLDNLNIC